MSKSMDGTTGQATPAEHRWHASLHEAGHLVALYHRFDRTGFAVVTSLHDGQADGPTVEGTFSAAVTLAAGEAAEGLMRDFPPPGDTIPKARPGGLLSAVASPAAVAWFGPPDDAFSVTDEERLIHFATKPSSLNPDDLGLDALPAEDPWRWPPIYLRVRRVARALILRHKAEVRELAAVLFSTGEVDSHDFYEAAAARPRASFQ